MANTVLVGSNGHLSQRIDAGKHTLLADEPEDVGGQDQGPNPYELLLAALGACTSMTLELYAKRKGWPLQRVEVSLSQQQVHAKDCVDCETRDVRMDRITKRIRLFGPLDDAQRKRLLEIAERCPVNRTLTGEISMETELVRPEGPAD